MRRFLIFLILCVLSFGISAQEIPKNPNTYDLDSNKTGAWTILYDNDWNITDVIDSVEFYRVITYERGTPSGKVVDYEVSGIKMWEGFLYSDSPIREYFGKNTWFFDDGSILETAFFKDSVLDGVNVVYNKNGDTCLIINYNQGMMQNHKIYTIDSTSNKEYLTNKFHELYNQYYELEMYNTQLEISYILLKLGDELYTEKDSSYLFILENLYAAYYKTGYYQKALDLILRLEKLYGEVYGYESSFYIQTLSQIAASYNDIGDYNTSLEYSLESMEKSKDFFGENSYEYALDLNNTAYYYNLIGMNTESFALQEKSLKIRKNLFGKNSREYSTALGNMAGNYRVLGNNEQALKMYEEQLEINQIVYGTDHTSTALTLFYLANIYKDIDLNLSLDFCLVSLSIFENKLGKSSYYYTLSLSTLSDIYHLKNDIDSSIILQEQAINLRSEVLNPCHREIIVGSQNITHLYNEINEFDKSLSILQDLLLLVDSCHGNTSYLYIELLDDLIVQYYIMRDDDYLEHLSLVIDYFVDRYYQYENNFDESLLQIENNRLKEYFEYSFDASYLGEYNLWYFLKGRELSKKCNPSNQSGLFSVKV